jgi:glycosyltransferase involved in cell wall biosynthesis
MTNFAIKFKNFALMIWIICINFLVKRNSRIVTDENRSTIRVFFAGAIPGSRGGPRVKMNRLQVRFGQGVKNFDLLYCLSNYPYVNHSSIRSVKARGTPIILNQNGVYFPGWFIGDCSNKNAPNRNIYELCDYVFWQSAFARQSAREFLQVSDPPGEILFNAVDIHEFTPRSKPKTGPFTFLVAGNFNPSSIAQIEPALYALAKVRHSQDIGIVVAGLDKRSQKCVGQIVENLKIHDISQIRGPYANSQAPDLMRKVDAYIALKYMDTCPNLVIEAMASGLPIIYSATGGTKELVDERSGVGLHLPESWYQPPSFPADEVIADAMLRVLDSAAEMGAASRARAESVFDIERWYMRHEEVFLRLLGGRG